MAAPALAQQTYPPPYQPPPPAYQQPQAPAYQQPPPQYQQQPAQYQQAPPQYQQQPPQYQQQPPQYQQQPPQYQQQPPQYQQQPPYQAPPPAYPPAYPPPPPAYTPPPANQPYRSPSAASSTTHTANHSQQQGIRYHPWRVQIEGGYTITQGSSVKTLLNDGGSAGLGITWFPTAALPLGFRLDASYTSHPQTLHALDLASQSTGQNIADGYTDIYGGDLDAEIDLHVGQHSREYFFGGFGFYKERTTLKSVTYQQGYVCWFFCSPGYFPVYSTAQTTTSDWLKSWNAGIGFEFPLGDPATFFIDGRFLRIKQPNGVYWDFIPIRAGIRF
ncbi:MAG: hypothetical protein JOY74_10165 [Sinobacteraceae bacterium]|nr:hypothetical protein [Nevskiaceae bacterium]